ncbi:MAG TPA: DUF4159 domain-containing protein, partial [candidate division Zixibacteria bacterium]
MTLKVSKITIILFSILLIFFNLSISEIEKDPDAFTIARLKYAGGGDWYWGSSAIPNMLKFLKENTNIPVDENEIRVSIMDKELFNYPFLFLTGHGNIKFSDEEV